MQLSEAVSNLAGTLRSDGAFQCIAFATEQDQDQFVTFLEKEKFLPAMDNPHISCVLTTPELVDKLPPHIQGVFLCTRPKATLFQMHNQLAHQSAYIGKSRPTVTGTDCRISSLASIDRENIVIGDRVTIEPFAVVKGRVQIGNDVTIRSGAVIGCKGFSFSKDEAGQNISVEDTARIVIEDHVEIFEQVAISTGIFPWEETRIGRNTKIDAQCHVGHGAHIGKNCLLAEGCRCCGNSRLGDHVWIGVGAIVSNRVKVGDGARVSLGAVVTKDVPSGQTVSGNFAIEHQKFLSNLKKSLEE